MEVVGDPSFAPGDVSSNFSLRGVQAGSTTILITNSSTGEIIPHDITVNPASSVLVDGGPDFVISIGKVVNRPFFLSLGLPGDSAFALSSSKPSVVELMTPSVTLGPGDTIGSFGIRAVGPGESVLSLIGPSGQRDEIVVEVVSETASLFFPQIGNGRLLTSRFSSEFTFLSTASTTATGAVRFFDNDGTPLPIGIVTNGGVVQTSTVPFTIPANGGFTLVTSGEGDLVVGSAVVTSDLPLAGVVRFDIFGIGTAGIGAARSLTGFVVPVRFGPGGVDTGIAIQNTETKPVSIRLTLSDNQGEPVTNGTVTIENLPGNGHLARFITELFPDIIQDNFKGILTAEVVDGRVAATALEIGDRPGQFSALPVTPRSSLPGR